VVADALLPGASEGAYCLRKRTLVEVLRHHHPTRREKGPLAEPREQRLVEVAVVGRVQVNDVELHPLVGEGPDRRPGVLPEDPHFAPGVGERPRVLLRRLDRRRGLVHENHRRRAARERLESDPAVAGEGVEKPAAGDHRREDVEERLADARAGGTRRVAAGRLQPPALPRPRDDP